MSVQTTRSIWRNYLHYLIPTIIGAVAHTIYCMADVFFVSHGVGPTGLAGLNVALPIFTVYTMFSLLIGVGAATTISVCQGAGEPEKANTSFTLAFFLNLAIGILISVIGSLMMDDVARLLGADEQLLPYVTDYLRPISATAFMYMMSSMMTVIVRSDGAPKLVMVASTAGNLCNVLLDYVTVNLLQWGMFGAGLATAIGPCVSLMILSVHFVRKQNQIRFTRRIRDLRIVLRILRNGIGSSVLEISSGLVIFLFNIALLQVSGSQAVAVFTIISNIGYVGKGIFSGMAQAAQPMISIHYGAKDFFTLRQANRCAMITALVFAAVVYILILLFPDFIISTFVSNDLQILSMGRPAIRIYFLSFIFTGLNTILMYYFQSVEKASYTMTIAVLRGIVLIVAGLLILPHILQITGVWLTLPLAEILTFCLFFPLLFPFERRLQRSLSSEAK
ncbi:MAG TPA: MATE family efflux transporter [Firmicutes bacterium]|nr:MATE family efflux transporter [Bacillota bacterium]